MPVPNECVQTAIDEPLLELAVTGLLSAALAEELQLFAISGPHGPGGRPAFRMQRLRRTAARRDHEHRPKLCRRHRPRKGNRIAAGYSKWPGVRRDRPSRAAQRWHFFDFLVSR